MALSHCPACNLWLRPDERCLHIPAAAYPPVRAAANPRRVAVPVPQSGGGASGFFNDAGGENANRLATARALGSPFHPSPATP